MKRVVTLVSLVVGLGAIACADAGTGAGVGPPQARGRVTGSELTGPVVGSSALGLADDNTVVGTAHENDAESPFPVVWHPGEDGERLALPAEGHNGLALAVSEDGYVVGWYMDRIFMMPVHWKPGTDSARPAAPVRMETLGGALHGVFGANREGTAVGFANVGEYETPHAVRWDRTGAVTDLGTLPGHDVSVAQGINDEGVVVGQSGPTDLIGPAVRWDPDGTPTELALPADARNACAFAVNRAGVIVGLATAADQLSGDLAREDEWAVRWSPDGAAERLSVPGGAVATAQDINDSGEVVGDVRHHDGTERAVRWSPDGTRTELSPLPGDVASHARAINNRGYVAGESTDTAGRTWAVLWHPDGSVTALGRHSNHTVLPSPPASGR
ncbi:putative membrane protein [Streptomyces sp. PsTaAH-137]|nr:putative membrane protein [Streptomyces sp. PsTaAH-137]